MKSVCPMVCQKNENHLQKPSPTTADKSPVQNPAPIPLRPLRGLHSLHLNKSKRGEYNRGFALQTYLLNIQSKVFLVTLLSTPKEICSVIQQTLAENLPIPFPLEGDCGGEYKSLPLSSPPWGGQGVNTIKSFRSSERLPIPFPCMSVLFAFAQARANKCRCKIIKGGRGSSSLTLSTPGEPLR